MQYRVSWFVAENAMIFNVHLSINIDILCVIIPGGIWLLFQPTIRMSIPWWKTHGLWYLERSCLAGELPDFVILAMAKWKWKYIGNVKVYVPAQVVLIITMEVNLLCKRGCITT